MEGGRRDLPYAIAIGVPHLAGDSPRECRLAEPTRGDDRDHPLILVEQTTKSSEIRVASIQRIAMQRKIAPARALRRLRWLRGLDNPAGCRLGRRPMPGAF